jgi:hypothetical protein
MLARKCGIVPTARDTSPTKPLSENNSNIPQSVADDSNAKASLKDRLQSLQETYQHYETDLSPKKMSKLKSLNGLIAKVTFIRFLIYSGEKLFVSIIHIINTL